MKKLPKINTSKLLKAALPYILVGLMATKLGQAYRMASGGDVLDRIFGAFLKIGEAFTNPLPSLHPFDLLVGAACGALLWFIVYQKSKNARKYRRGAEYGTARWGNAKDIEPFIDPDFSQNILLSETERLTLGKIADPEKRNVNLNVLVIGGSGSGKTRYHIKPNLLQMNASYVCSDPKGTVIEEVGRALVRGGYKIKVLNTIDFSCSMHYNYYGGISLDGMMFKIPKMYTPVTDETGRITAFRQMREKDFSREQPQKKPEKKPSIREQLAKKPEQHTAAKPPAKRKDLER